MCTMFVDCLAVFDITQVTDRLRDTNVNSGWLMLVDGRQKLNDRKFANAADLLNGGSYFLLRGCLCICLLLSVP